MGRFTPVPHTGGMHAAKIPAPPGVAPVRVKEETVPIWLSLLTTATGTLFVVTLASSVMSACKVRVCVTFSDADVVGEPAGSPLRCSVICTGMQLRKLAAGELTLPSLAMTPISPGALAVTRPLASTVPTVPLLDVHVKVPTWLVMSLALGAHGPEESCGVASEEQAVALYCWVCLMDVQALVGEACSATIEETCRCTETVIGVLLTPFAVAVMVALPVSGLPPESVPLQTTNDASQTPAQTRPLVETVTRLGFDEVKVTVAITELLAEFSAAALSWPVSPETSEREAGLSVTWVTVLLALEPPPQPAREAAQIQMIATLPTQDRMPPPRPAVPRRNVRN